MKILFITLNSIEMNTSSMIRNKALINGLTQIGHKVDLLTVPAVKTSKFYDSTSVAAKGVKLILLNENKAYTSLVRESKGLKGKIKKILLPIIRRVYSYTQLFDNTIYTAKKARKNEKMENFYDLIISSSDPKSSHVAAEKLIESGLKCGKWIQYWGDPLSIDITKKSIHPKWYTRMVEMKLFSYADKIVYVSPLTLEEQRESFPRYQNKMAFIPIPYMNKKYYDPSKRMDCYPKMGYFGDYYANVRTIKPIYNYCSSNKINLVVAGNSNLQLQSKDRITIYPRIGKSEVEKLESECDILVCILNKLGTQIPGKIYHYAATNKPILIILDGDRKNQIMEYLLSFERFILCENNENSIKKAVDEILKGDMEYEPSPHFDSKIIAEKLLNI